MYFSCDNDSCDSPCWTGYSLLRYVGISWATLSCPSQPVVKKSSDEVVKLIIMSSYRFEAFWDPTVSYMYMDDKQHNPWYIDLGECSN